MMEMLNNVEPRHKTEWDYNGLEEWEHGDKATQSDWNMTLVTKFNEISKFIHLETFRGGANLIIANPKMKSLFETMAYYNHENPSFIHRYEVVYDPDAELDEIHMVYDPDRTSGTKIKEGYMIIPEKGENDEGDEEMYLKIYEVEKNKALVDDYLSKSKGVIKVKNYE